MADKSNPFNHSAYGGPGWPLRLVCAGADTLSESGYKIVYFPVPEETLAHSGFNSVTIAPREIVMPAGNPNLQSFLENLKIKCHAIDVSELSKTADAIGCLTGILHREFI